MEKRAACTQRHSFWYHEFRLFNISSLRPSTLDRVATRDKMRSDNGRNLICVIDAPAASGTLEGSGESAALGLSSGILDAQMTIH
uniref:Uncharacterized protein n=1 Tax=Babesia bovis TaxID=5865 RepID=S6BGB7_BABBO|nr:hypothetical protein [Babesia bovis]